MTNQVFVETVNLRSANWLNTQLSAEFTSLYADPDELANFTFIKKIIQSFIKGHGSIKTTYKRSQYDTEGIFRLYSSGGIQQLPSKFRGILCNELSTDIDIVNCHPMIAFNLCKRHEIECPYLTKYCTERKQLIESGKISKTDFLRIMNKTNKTKGLSSWGIACDGEIKHIQQELTKYYPQIYRMAENKSKKNPYGTFMSYLCQSFETKIIESIVAECPYKVRVLMFDGFLVDGVVPDDYCDSLSSFVKSKFDMDIQFSIKPHDTSLVIPDDYQFDDPEVQYLTLKKRYEAQGLSYIERSSNYCLRIGGSLEFKTKDEMIRHFERIVVDEECFFLKWVKDPTAQVFQDVGMYPHDVPCPDGILNLWTGFDIEKYPCELVDIQPVLELIHILTNHEEASYDFLLKWLANMFQYPSSPSVMVALCSLEEGAGKGSLVNFLKNIVGLDKYALIKDPERQLFGTFNGHLANSVLINIDECKRNDMVQFYERLKSDINGEENHVHNKGQKEYSIANIRHYIATFNPPDSIKYLKNSRRYFMTYCSEEKVGDGAYFEQLNRYLENKQFQYSFFRYLMDLPTKKRFIQSDIPITKMMIEAIAMNRDPLEDYAMQFRNGCDSDELYVEYREFIRESGLKEPLCRKTFEMRFSRIMDKYSITKTRTDKVVNGERVQKRVYARALLELT